MQALINEYPEIPHACPKSPPFWDDFGYLKRSYIFGSHQETTQYKSLKKKIAKKSE